MVSELPHLVDGCGVEAHKSLYTKSSHTSEGSLVLCPCPPQEGAGCTSCDVHISL